MKYKYEIQFIQCIYAGISKEIKFQLEFGKKDETEMLQELVDRYSNEYMLSSKYLHDELEEYKEKWKNI